MKHVVEAPHWPEAWKLSNRFDQLEVYGRLPPAVGRKVHFGTIAALRKTTA
jgi:hypothetical protein